METFGTVVNCIDGRAHPPVTAWMRTQAGVTFIDRVTQPGTDRALSEGDPAVVAELRAQVALSVSAHGSRVVAVVGHHDCAANPATREEHLAQIRRSVERVREWQLPVEVVGLWVNERWEVEVVVGDPALVAA